ncbi:MAG: thiamine phosphate synthase [Alphaproteobacteria bacterium]|nr:thiamine phosphate synthase [Alphaproteobacteria bacterium]
MTIRWTDRGLNGGRDASPILAFMTDIRLADNLSVLNQLPAGAWVILRFLPGRPFPLDPRTAARLCKERHLKLLVAKDHRLAERIGADGLHLPEAQLRQACLSPALSWLRAKPGRLLSISAHSERALLRAAKFSPDAILCSPVFATASHPEAKPLGSLRFARLCRLTKRPVIALGGIRRATALRLAFTKAAGFAGTSFM